MKRARDKYKEHLKETLPMLVVITEKLKELLSLSKVAESIEMSFENKGCLSIILSNNIALTVCQRTNFYHLGFEINNEIRDVLIPILKNANIKYSMKEHGKHGSIQFKEDDIKKHDNVFIRIAELERDLKGMKYDKPSLPLDERRGIDKNEGGKNIIFYGVPGSGKSHIIKKKIGEMLGCDDEELDDEYNNRLKDGRIVRVVFHPDYTYSDFTGQILPSVNKDIEKVTYEFRPGPFTRILEKAVAKPTERFFLIIEEINRGNAAAIFGDLFQLLDRNYDEERKDKNYGESEYCVDNHEIGKFVHKDKITDSDGNVPPIVIPPNLWLLATMNTSDQNVFPLDTAFQRRWEMELIRNDFGPKQEFLIGDTGVTWEKFAKAVNTILGNPSEMASGDKRLGAWFIQRDQKMDDKKFKELFANKVLKYLWDDAFKFDRKPFFNPEMKTLEDVIDKFVKGSKDFGNILSDDAKKAILENAEG